MVHVDAGLKQPLDDGAVRPSVAGANVARFKRALKPGRYRAVVSAVDAAGNRSAVKRLRFRVAR